MTNYDKYMRAVREFKALPDYTTTQVAQAAENKLRDTWNALTKEEQERAKVERLK
jgi:hypothetical protein